MPGEMFGKYIYLCVYIYICIYIYTYIYIYALLEGTKNGNATKRADKGRHSNIQFFLLKGGRWSQWARPPKRGPWALWAHFSELWGDRRYSMSRLSFFALL